MNPYTSEVARKCDGYYLYLRDAHRLTPDHVTPHLIEKGRQAAHWAKYLAEGGQDSSPLQRVVDALPGCKTLLEAADLFDTASAELAGQPPKEAKTVPAHETFDNQDGTFSTQQPPPQSTQIFAVLGEITQKLWRHESVSTDTNLNWLGDKGVYHTATNSTVGIPVFVGSRDASPHDTTITVTGFAGATVKLSWARYKVIDLISFFGFATYLENALPEKLRVASRQWVDRTFGGKECPDILMHDSVVAQVPASGSQTFFVDVIVPKGATGTITGDIVLTHAGGTVTLPVEIPVRGAELTDANPKPNLMFLPHNLGERAVGGLFETPGSADFTPQMTWLKAAAKVLREHGADPIFSDCRQANGLPTPVPDADRLEILDGSVYAGEPWRGATAHTWDACGMYSDINSYENLSAAADDDAKRDIVTALHATRRTTLDGAGLSTLKDVHYTNDEGTYAAANQVAYWLSNVPNNLPMATFDTTTGHIIEPAMGYPGDAVAYAGETFDGTNPDPTRRQAQGAITAEAPLLKICVGAGHVITRTTKRIFDYFRSLGNYAANYNGQSYARGSMMIEEDPRSVILNAVVDYKMGNNIWFSWNAALFYHVEFRTTLTDAEHAALGTTGQWKPTTGPNAGQHDPRRQNVWRYAHTFGDLITRDDVFNRGDKRASNGDGVLLYLGSDQHYADDPLVPGTNEVYASLRLKHYREWFQLENLLYLCAAKDQAATDLAVNAFYPFDPHRVGAGPNGEAGVYDNNRSYVSGADADTGTLLAQRFQDQKTGSDYEQFKRDLFAIMEA